jgi:hypothetical protein
MWFAGAGLPEDQQSPWLVLPKACSITAFAAGKVLTLPYCSPLENLVLTGSILVALVLCITFAPRRLFVAAGLLFTLGSIQTILIAAFRGGHAMNEARYTYMPAFGVCFLIGLTLESLVGRASLQWQKPIYAVAAMAIAMLAVGQRQSAAEGRRLVDIADAATTNAVYSYRKLAIDAAVLAKSQNTTIRLVDGPLYLPGRFPPGAYLPWRGLIVAYGSEPLQNLELVTPEFVTQAEINATVALITTSREQAATLMQATVYRILPDLLALSWLSTTCRQEGIEVTIPNADMTYPQYNLGFSVVACDLFAFRRRLPNLRVASGPLSDAESATLAELLDRYNNPFSLRLRQLLILGDGTSAAPKLLPEH